MELPEYGTQGNGWALGVWTEENRPKAPPRSPHARDGRRTYTSTDPVTMTRRCSWCGAWKPLEEFARAASQPFGRDYYCKPCQNDRHKPARERAKWVKEAKKRYLR